MSLIFLEAHFDKYLLTSHLHQWESRLQLDLKPLSNDVPHY